MKVSFSEELKKLIQERASARKERTYGFEYELIGRNALSPLDFKNVKSCLAESSFSLKDGMIIDSHGMYITFEPGGQIEFSSPPLKADDMELFDILLESIEETVSHIARKTGVEYISTDYIPGRDKAPMLLEAQRYHDLHRLLGEVSDRGRDMMKGTAAIHLHASICSFDELLRLWETICALSREEGFAMGAERRDIWDRTDPSRCGLTCSQADNITTPDKLIDKLVLFAMKAFDLRSGVPFNTLKPAPDFNDFLYHFTTIFTDVRVNLKGMTLELRTLDSRPLHMFRGAWMTYLDMVQQFMDDSK